MKFVSAGGTTVARSLRDDRATAVTTTDGTVWTWADLDHEFRPSIAAYAASRGVRHSDDVAQDVLLTALERLTTFTGSDAALRSWMFTIAYRRIADHHRTHYRRPELLVADQILIPSETPTAEDRTLDLATVGTIMAAFAVLSKRERHILERRIFDEASPDEIARELNLRSGHVRVLQCRALTKIRSQLRTADRALVPASSAAFAFLPSRFIDQLRIMLGAGSLTPAATGGVGLLAKVGVATSVIIGAAAIAPGALETGGNRIVEPTIATTMFDGGARPVIEQEPGDPAASNGRTQESESTNEPPPTMPSPQSTVSAADPTSVDSATTSASASPDSDDAAPDPGGGTLAPGVDVSLPVPVAVEPISKPPLDLVDNTILDNTILDSTILDSTILDSTILDSTILDSTILEGATDTVDRVADTLEAATVVDLPIQPDAGETNDGLLDDGGTVESIVGQLPGRRISR